MQSTHVPQVSQSPAHVRPTYSELITLVLNQEWRRYGDETQINGVAMASRLLGRGVFGTLLDALSAISDSQVGDTRQTGVSAWTRTA